MHSAIYRGWLEHRRVTPVPHGFGYRLFMVYLDLAELDTVFRGRWLWSTTRRALARFVRADHLGDPALPLDESVRRLVAERTGWRPAGPIRLLTHLRYLGYVFNPVSFYYCFDAEGRNVEAIVAEVNNTPWGEQHCYVLRPSDPGMQGLAARSTKAMHVSPFHPMGLEYDWRFSPPGDSLAVHMSLRPRRDTPDAAEPRPIFGAGMSLRRQEIGASSLARVLLRFPLMTAQVIVAIHWQALRLWLKRIPVHDHPAKHLEPHPEPRP